MIVQASLVLRGAAAPPVHKVFTNADRAFAVNAVDGGGTTAALLQAGWK